MYLHHLLIISIICNANDGDIFLNTDIAGRRSRTNFCDIPTLDQICQSSFYGNFAYIRAKLHDFFLGNLADLLVNNYLNSIRLRKVTVLQMLYTTFKFIICFQHNTQIIFHERFIAVFALMPTIRTCFYLICRRQWFDQPTDLGNQSPEPFFPADL